MSLQAEHQLNSLLLSEVTLARAACRPIALRSASAPGLSPGGGSIAGRHHPLPRELQGATSLAVKGRR